MTSCRIGFVLLLVLVAASAGCEGTSPATAQSTEKPSTVESEEPQKDGSPPAATAEQQIVDTSFDDIKFEMEKTEKFKREMLTPKVEKLLDRKIRIRGYMYPTLKKRGLKSFVLVRDNLECCFGPGAALYDCILVTMNEGKTAEYSIRPIAVEGTFRFKEVDDGSGNTLAVYSLDSDSAE